MKNKKSRLKACAVAVSILSVIITILMIQKTMRKADLDRINIYQPPDFIMYFSGAKLVQEGVKQDLYDYKTQLEKQNKIVSPKTMRGLLAFRAPPLVAHLLKPLANLSYTHAFYSMAAINILLTASLITLLWNTSTVNKAVWKKVLFVLPLFLPFWGNIHGGQLSIFVLFLMSLSYFLIISKKPLMSGLVLGFLFTRPQFLILIPLILAFHLKDKGFKKLMAGTVLSLVGMFLINTYLYGSLSFWFEYPRYLLASESLSHGTHPFFNYNLSSLLSLFIPSHSSVNIVNIIINTTIYLIIIFLITRDAGKGAVNKPLAWAVAAMLTPLLNLHTMPVDLVVFLLPLYLVSSYLFEQKEFKKMYTFAAIIILLPWGAYLYLNFLTTIIFLIAAAWVFKMILLIRAQEPS